MMRGTVRRVLLAALLSMICCSGCLPTAQSPLDEQKESHFLEGKSLANALDFTGAIEAFDKALEVNPHSASAHFELAWIYDQKAADPAAAIYHYDRYLKYRPAADNAETIKTRIVACKQELARTVSLGPVTQTMQKELEQLNEQNKKLKEDIEKMRPYYLAAGGAGTNPPAPPPPPAAEQPAGQVKVLRANAETGGSTPVLVAMAGSNRAEPATRDTAAPHTHVVKAGETPSIIARKYSIKLDALMAANPRLDARKLKVGQVLNLPPH
jgi:LysM repeat protein